MSMVSLVCLRRVGSLAAASAPTYMAPQVLSVASGVKKFEADILNKSKFVILPSNNLGNHFLSSKKSLYESQILGPLTRSEFLVSDNDIVQCSSGAKSDSAGNSSAPVWKYVSKNNLVFVFCTYHTQLPSHLYYNQVETLAPNYDPRFWSHNRSVLAPKRDPDHHVWKIQALFQASKEVPTSFFKIKPHVWLI